MIKNIEAHLMVCNVNRCMIFFHHESDYHPFTTLQIIIDLGIVIDPGISVETVRELFNVSKNVLVVAVLGWRVHVQKYRAVPEA